MFPKGKQEEQPKDPSVQKEAIAENKSLQPIGNQASQGKMRDAFQKCWGSIADKEDSRTHIVINSLIREVFSEVEN